ncbi:MAG: sulfite exporter TauE/SafE family protein [Planctomycetota bacterium]
MDDLTTSIAVVSIGLGAGLIGGMTGLGGSIIMLPGLAIVIGFASESRIEQHMYIAAALCVNFLVAVPATWRHSRAGTVRRAVVVRLLPPAGIAMVLGVLLSNRVDPTVLIKMLAAMIVVFVVVGELGSKLSKPDDTESDDEIAKKRAGVLAGTGAFTGTLAGLLGIGGGVIMVATLRAIARMRVRAAIAASSATMCLMAPIGATLKLATLHTHGLSWVDAVRLAGLMGPAAVVGSLIGSSLVHRFPRLIVRLVVDSVLLLAAARLGGLI